LRLQLERLDYDNKERTITIDILKEQNQDLGNELEEVRRQMQEARANQKDIAAEDREKKKQEKMALMMSKFEDVSDPYPLLAYWDFLRDIRQSHWTRKFAPQCQRLRILTLAQIFLHLLSGISQSYGASCLKGLFF
jgi:FtsZ-binding cell division protein ZapB